MMNRVQRQNSPPPPRICAVAGGRSAVGVTTIGVNLAIALAQQGQRTVIVDADLARADVARRCGVTPAASIADVLAAKRGIHEVLERGPGGIQLAAGCDNPQSRALCSERAIGRLLNQIRALGRHTDAVVIDVGSAPTDLTSRVWQAADHALVVTTPDSASLLDAYAIIKSLAANMDHRRPLGVIVNQADVESLAIDVHARIDRSCRQFLGLTIDLFGWLPKVNGQAATADLPWVLQQPSLPAATMIEQMASRLLSGQDDPVHEAA